MIRSLFTPRLETRAPHELACTQQVSLSAVECTRLRLFAVRLGVGIADDTSPFSRTERNRLLFLHWLDLHGQLSS